MDQATITIVGGVAVAIIGALCAGVVKIINALGTLDKKVSHVGDAVDTVNTDTVTIKEHTNSMATLAQGREALLQNEVRLLRDALADRRNAAALTAQSAAYDKAATATILAQSVVKPKETK